MAHYALPYPRGTTGNIVSISSKTAVTGQGATSGYVARTGAIPVLSRKWVAEFLPYGIRVNAVVPAEVMPPLYRQWLDSFPDPERQLQRAVAKIPLAHRMTMAEEVAATVRFLLSSKADHITGSRYSLTAGMCISIAH
jgi:L-fucose dehydrogenase